MPNIVVHTRRWCHLYRVLLRESRKHLCNTAATHHNIYCQYHHAQRNQYSLYYIRPGNAPVSAGYQVKHRYHGNYDYARLIGNTAQYLKAISNAFKDRYAVRYHEQCNKGGRYKAYSSGLIAHRKESGQRYRVAALRHHAHLQCKGYEYYNTCGKCSSQHIGHHVCHAIAVYHRRTAYYHYGTVIGCTVAQRRYNGSYLSSAYPIVIAIFYFLVHDKPHRHKNQHIQDSGSYIEPNQPICFCHHTFHPPLAFLLCYSVVHSKYLATIFFHHFVSGKTQDSIIIPGTATSHMMNIGQFIPKGAIFLPSSLCFSIY